MKIRVIDYVGNLGGAARHIIEILGELVAAHPQADLELVSHAAPLEHYRRLLAGRGIRIPLLDIAPAGRHADTHYSPSILERLSRRWAPWNIRVPSSAAGDSDVVWAPWIHRHFMSEDVMSRTVGTVVDIITLQFGLLRRASLAQERHCLRRWLRSAATLVAISDTTAEAMAEYFSITRHRISTIYLSGDRPHVAGQVQADWTWSDKPFLLYPANISAHKNHETLFHAFASWGGRYPLVLTGGGVEKLAGGRGGLLHYSRRARRLTRAAGREGLSVGETLLPLGYITDGEYYALLDRAWALVMPTLAEGCGLPVLEALQAGVPVVCSDIPAIREHVKLLGGQVLWIDPCRPETLTSALADLDKNYDAHKHRAMEQVDTLHRRPWAQVAHEYWEVFKTVAGAGG